jgi:hypothetical protein
MPGLLLTVGADFEDHNSALSALVRTRTFLPLVYGWYKGLSRMPDASNFRGLRKKIESSSAPLILPRASANVCKYLENIG